LALVVHVGSKEHKEQQRGKEGQEAQIAQWIVVCIYSSVHRVTHSSEHTDNTNIATTQSKEEPSLWHCRLQEVVREGHNLRQVTAIGGIDSNRYTSVMKEEAKSIQVEPRERIKWKDTLAPGTREFKAPMKAVLCVKRSNTKATFWSCVEEALMEAGPTQDVQLA
jgi:hypothetical protein